MVYCSVFEHKLGKVVGFGVIYMTVIGMGTVLVEWIKMTSYTEGNVIEYSTCQANTLGTDKFQKYRTILYSD